MATQHYEAFAHPPLDFKMCVINLDDYTRPVRAKILYNHIYFSDLPKEYKLALLEERGYEKILGHRNYNPRVIEFMTQSRHAGTVEPTLYLREFFDSLDSPARIWDHAFRHQISEAGRHLLFALTTLPNETRVEDLEKAFSQFYGLRQRRFGFPTGASDWIDALKELDGNFIKTGKIGDSIVVSFHNPSVRDFMEKFLQSSDSDAVDLLRAAMFYEQYTSLWSGADGRSYRGIERAGNEFLKALAANLWGPSARGIRMVNHKGETIGLTTHPPSNESRAAFFIRVVDQLQPPAAAHLVESVLSQLSELWKGGSADREDLVRLLEVLTKRGLREHETPFRRAKQCLLTPPETIDEFRAAATFVEKYPDTVSQEERDLLRGQFSEFASDNPSSGDDDPDWLHQISADIEYVGKRLNVDTQECRQMLAERADEIESERAGLEPPDDREERWESSDSDVDDVQGMFDGLARDLREG
jgi:hypothetical protein